jgi:hypothetical protein
MLKWTVQKYGVRVWTGFTWLMSGSRAGLNFQEPFSMEVVMFKFQRIRSIWESWA